MGLPKQKKTVSMIFFFEFLEDFSGGHPRFSRPAKTAYQSRKSIMLRLNPAPTGVVHRRGPHGRLLPRDAACAAATRTLRPWRGQRTVFIDGASFGLPGRGS